MIFGAETHYGGGVMSTFVFHRPPLLERPTLLFIGSTAVKAHKASDYTAMITIIH